MAAISQRYEYTYGAGSSPNRRVEFYEQDGTFTAVIFGKRMGEWIEITRLAEKSMFQEQMSTSQKIAKMNEARGSGASPNYPPDRSFSNISREDKLLLLNSLSPDGSWSIMITNSLGGNPRFEVATHLHFFDPS